MTKKKIVKKTGGDKSSLAQLLNSGLFGVLGMGASSLMPKSPAKKTIKTKNK